MGGEQAAGVLAQLRASQLEKSGRMWSDEDRAAFMQPHIEEYDRKGRPLYASARLWDDGIIDPADTRRVLSLSLSACYNAPVEDTRFGVFRM
jgi:3-methylcrotonyl-CoA carboxylase beta subunit